MAVAAVRVGGRKASSGTFLLLLTVIGAAWAFSVWAEFSGVAAQLHHHALYRGGLPLWWAAVLLLGAWQAMTAAMMLPSSLPLVRLYSGVVRGKPQSGVALLLFLLAYFAVWTGFALVAFTGDMGLHHLVHAWPWLAAHSQVIPAATLGFAALYQLTPIKDACLRACRHPAMYLRRYYRRGAVGGLQLGLGHAVFCLGCCWALMLVMFAAGVAHLAWMGMLALIMLAEKSFPAGDSLVRPVGILLALLSLSALMVPGSVFGL